MTWRAVRCAAIFAIITHGCHRLLLFLYFFFIVPILSSLAKRQKISLELGDDATRTFRRHCRLLSSHTSLKEIIIKNKKKTLKTKTVPEYVYT